MILRRLDTSGQAGSGSDVPQRGGGLGGALAIPGCSADVEAFRVSWRESAIPASNSAPSRVWGKGDLTNCAIAAGRMAGWDLASTHSILARHGTEKAETSL